MAAHAALVFIDLNGQSLPVTPEELVDVTVAAAEGRLAVEALAIWFRQRLRPADVFETSQH